MRRRLRRKSDGKLLPHRVVLENQHYSVSGSMLLYSLLHSDVEASRSAAYCREKCPQSNPRGRLCLSSAARCAERYIVKIAVATSWRKGCSTGDGLSPAAHPAMGRVPGTFEPT